MSSFDRRLSKNTPIFPPPFDTENTLKVYQDETIEKKYSYVRVHGQAWLLKGTVSESTENDSQKLRDQCMWLKTED